MPTMPTRMNKAFIPTIYGKTRQNVDFYVPKQRAKNDQTQ
jgi:hypothetical protein